MRATSGIERVYVVRSRLGRELKAEQQIGQGKGIRVTLEEGLGLTLWHACQKGWSLLF